MDANSRRILGLLSEMNTRFVVPVYQRPYSWGEQQCTQLWEDILSCGRRGSHAHFTGSIVTIQDGSLSDQGVSSLLLIDGQQRLTTIALLLIALARHARAHVRESLPFSYEEIVRGGYLTNPYRTGEDHYKLMLSKGDQVAFRTLIDGLEGSQDTRGDVSGRLSDNLSLFEDRLAGLRDVGSVWAGLQRLEVVSIALSQGVDNPQVIFESMNSTGKDLSSADLIRNFVLMSQPVAEQSDAYLLYWKPIENMLGGSRFDVTFDDFIRSYLTAVSAPASFADVDAYHAFKRHVLLGGYHEHDRMKNFCLRLKRFAHYYAVVTRVAVPADGEGEAQASDLDAALSRLAMLDAPVVTPLLMALLDQRDHHALSDGELLRMLSAIESYLVRRVVCDLPGSVLPTLVSSLIARLDAVAAEGGSCPEALGAMLLNEGETSRRFPSDAEFAHALRTRDAYDCKQIVSLLAGLENALREDGGAVFVPDGYVVERVLPPRALSDETWRALLGQDPEGSFEACVNNIGNLVLTPFDFELQEGAFDEKRARLVDATGAMLVMARDVVGERQWDAHAIKRRAERLVETALRVWSLPQIPEATRRMYHATGRAAWTDSITFSDLFENGLVQMDDALVSGSPLYPGRATVTSRGRIMLVDGESFDDPAVAYDRLLSSLGVVGAGLDGWIYWRVGDGGPTLDDLRAKLL